MRLSIPSRRSTGVWYHIAGGWGGPSQTSRTCYVNGDAATENIGSRDADFIGAISIGAITGTSTFNYFNGEIAHVGVWDEELNLAEMESLAAGYCPILVRPSALVSYFPLNETSASDNAIDIWGNSELTAVNSPGVSSDSPPIIYRHKGSW